MYGTPDQCAIATSIVDNAVDDNRDGINVSFNYLDIALEQYCTLSGCKERFVEFYEICIEPVSVKYCFITVTKHCIITYS